MAAPKESQWQINKQVLMALVKKELVQQIKINFGKVFVG